MMFHHRGKKHVKKLFIIIFVTPFSFVYALRLQSELMTQRKDNRERFGYQVDFEDYKPPFQSHVDDLVITMEKT